MSTPAALYRLFGEDEALLYVGISNSFMRRWYHHSLQTRWWTEARRATLEWFPDEEAALAAEKAAIKAEAPRYNRAHNEAQRTARRPLPRKRAPRPEAAVPAMAVLQPEPLMLEAEAAELLGMTEDELAGRRRARAVIWIELPCSDDYVRYDPDDVRAYREKLLSAA